MNAIAKKIAAQFLLSFYFLLFTSGIVCAQTIPQKFSFQSIIRNPGGQALQNQNIGMRLSILQGSETGTAVYSETHSGTTNASGLVTLQVGGGAVVSGSMATINWANGPFYIKTETDPNGGSNYSISGSSQLLSVPYALNAANGVANGTATNQIMYWNGTAWVTLAAPQTQGQVLTFCNGILTWTTGGICPANLPTLTTTAASAISTTSASSGGNISNDGGGSITERGICWGTSQNPTIALTTKTSDGTGTGTFTSSLTALSPNTLYYVRAYATNSAGTAYGNQVSFTTTTAGGTTDVDGNTYTTVTIGTQVWMQENLKVSKYRNSDPMTTNLSNSAWPNTTIGAYAIYNNDAANNATYGKLYNWYAVADPRGLCPTGWHVPSDAEWTTLVNFLGGASIAGGKMKSTGTLQAGTGLWQDPNTGATNSSGFTAFPGGFRNFDVSFAKIGYYGGWWASTELTSTNAWFRGLGSDTAYSVRDTSYKAMGFSVRCLRD